MSDGLKDIVKAKREERNMRRDSVKQRLFFGENQDRVIPARFIRRKVRDVILHDRLSIHTQMRDLECDSGAIRKLTFNDEDIKWARDIQAQKGRRLLEDLAEDRTSKTKLMRRTMLPRNLKHTFDEEDDTEEK